jgi:hypothetical protein
MSLSNTQRAVLTAAAQHPERLAVPLERLPAGARKKVAEALLRQNLVASTQTPSQDAGALWPVDGESVLLQITDDGLRAIGIEPTPPQDAQQTASESTAQDVPTAPLGGPEPAPQGRTTPRRLRPPRTRHRSPLRPFPCDRVPWPCAAPPRPSWPPGTRRSGPGWTTP